jgi:hypothetical protein
MKIVVFVITREIVSRKSGVIALKKRRKCLKGEIWGINTKNTDSGYLMGHQFISFLQDLHFLLFIGKIKFL